MFGRSNTVCAVLIRMGYLLKLHLKYGKQAVTERPRYKLEVR